MKRYKTTVRVWEGGRAIDRPSITLAQNEQEAKEKALAYASQFANGAKLIELQEER